MLSGDEDSHRLDLVSDTSAQSLPLRATVQQSILDLIVTRKLEPGGHLREAALAEQLGVSRVPVREALLALAFEGWIDQKKARGSFVHVPTEKEVEDTFALRTMLESEAALLAASRIQAHEISELTELCGVGRKALDEGNQSLVVQTNAAFHGRIVEIADNLELRRVQATISKRVAWYFGAVVRVRGYDSWREHEQIVDALQDGDGATASALMAMHARRTWKTYFEMQHPNAQADTGSNGE